MAGKWQRQGVEYIYYMAASSDKNNYKNRFTCQAIKMSTVLWENKNTAIHVALNGGVVIGGAGIGRCSCCRD